MVRINMHLLATLALLLVATNATFSSLHHVQSDHDIDMEHEPILRRAEGLEDADAPPHQQQLGFAIDTTGSMRGYMEALRQPLKQAIQTALQQPSQFILSKLHDSLTASVQISTSFADVALFLDTLSFSGGGDCPEEIFSGVQATLSRFSSSGALFVFTDASAKDANPSRLSSLITACLSKRVRVYFFLYANLCGTGEPAYAALAAATGGQVFTGLSSLDGVGVAGVVELFSIPNRGEILRILPDETTPTVSITGVAAAGLAGPAGPAAGITRRQNRHRRMQRTRSFSSLSTPNRDYSSSGDSSGPRSNLLRRAPFATTISFSLDSTVSSLIISVDGTSSSTAGVRISRPDGTVVRNGNGDANVQVLSLTRGVVYSLAGLSPATVGIWTIAIADCEACSVTVSGESPLRIGAFDLIQGGEPVLSSPVVACVYRAVARVFGSVRDASFELRSAGGELLAEVQMTADTNDAGLLLYYVGEVEIPEVPFQVYLRARDQTGNAVLRVYPRLIMGTPNTGTCPPVDPAVLATVTATTGATTTSSLQGSTSASVLEGSTSTSADSATSSDNTSSTETSITSTTDAASSRETTTTSGTLSSAESSISDNSASSGARVIPTSAEIGETVTSGASVTDSASATGVEETITETPASDVSSAASSGARLIPSNVETQETTSSASLAGLRRPGPTTVLHTEFITLPCPSGKGRCSHHHKGDSVTTV